MYFAMSRVLDKVTFLGYDPERSNGLKNQGTILLTGFDILSSGTPGLPFRRSCRSLRAISFRPCW